MEKNHAEDIKNQLGKDEWLEKEVNERFFNPQDNLPSALGFHDKAVVVYGMITIICASGQTILNVMPLALQIGYEYNRTVAIEHSYAKIFIEPRMHA